MLKTIRTTKVSFFSRLKNKDETLVWIFPKKLTYKDFDCRTPKINNLYSLITNSSKPLEQNKKGKSASKKANFPSVEATLGVLNPIILEELENLWKIKLVAEDRDRYRGRVYRDEKWEKVHRKRKKK